MVHNETDATTLVERFYGHPFIYWNELQQIFFTNSELKDLHKFFVHPLTDKLFNLLKRFELQNVNENTRAMFEDITRRCKPFQTYAQAPRGFKFSLRDDKDFNRTVFVNIFYTNSKPVLHAVDESTRYRAARWLSNVMTKSVRCAMRLCSIDVYFVLPDVVVHYAGKQFVAKVFQTNAKLLHIDIKWVPIESLNSMTNLEPYYTPICHAYKIVESGAPDLDEEVGLQIAIKSVNDSTCPGGRVSILLVYGALPRFGFPSNKATPSTHQRAIAQRKAAEATSKLFAKTQISRAVRIRNGPDTSHIHPVLIDSHVLVYSTELDRLDRPFCASSD